MREGAAGESRKPGARHRRILAVVNPVAGPRGSQRAARDLRERAAKIGVDLDVVETRPDCDGYAAVNATLTETPYDCYLVLGGDGTVMEVAGAAMRDGVPLAIIPRGTANAVAWHFGLPFDVGQALKVAVEGKPIRIDVGRTRHRDFLIMAGVGYDAAIVRDATRVLKRRFGFLAYLYAALKNLGRRPNTFRIHLDHEPPVRVRGMSAVITNIGSLAGNVRMVRQVDPQDGKLDLVVFSMENFGDFFRLLFWGLLGKLEQDPRVRYFQGSQIRIECRPLAPLEIDGDEVPGRHRELAAEVLPEALTLMVPAEGRSRFPWMPEVTWTPSGINLPKGPLSGKS
jgi:diacylglycerol kinase (ATP)